jgi:hypothetical protein
VVCSSLLGRRCLEPNIWKRSWESVTALRSIGYLTWKTRKLWLCGGQGLDLKTRHRDVDLVGPDLVAGQLQSQLKDFSFLRESQPCRVRNLG